MADPVSYYISNNSYYYYYYYKLRKYIRMDLSTFEELFSLVE